MTFIFQIRDSLVKSFSVPRAISEFRAESGIAERDIYQRLIASLHALPAGFSAAWS